MAISIPEARIAAHSVVRFNSYDDFCTLLRQIIPQGDSDYDYSRRESMRALLTYVSIALTAPDFSFDHRMVDDCFSGISPFVDVHCFIGLIKQPVASDFNVVDYDYLPKYLRTGCIHDLDGHATGASDAVDKLSERDFYLLLDYMLTVGEPMPWCGSAVIRYLREQKQMSEAEILGFMALSLDLTEAEKSDQLQCAN